MLVYRITHKSFSKSLKASGIGGRWNSEGKKVIYCSESVPLAFLESMIRRQGVGFNDDFRIMVIEVPDDLPITVIDDVELEDGWREFRDYSKCQYHGDRWYEEGKTTLLKVPSAVMPEAHNYVINSSNKDFKKIKVVAVTDLVPDERIEDLLKKYKSR
jgi:RES domain-containing protein